MALLAFIVLYLACWVQAGQHGTVENSTAATLFALEYGYPLVAWTKLAKALLVTRGVNTLAASTELANASSTTVVAPNVDTLYSTAAFDLSAGDLIVTVPHVDPGRYWSFSFYDPLVIAYSDVYRANETRFGDNFAVLGSISGSPAGNYTFRWLQRWKIWPSVEEPALIIDSPVAYGILLIRILVRNNGSDLAQAREIINSCNLTKVEGQPQLIDNNTLPLSLATFANITFANTSAASAPVSLLELTARTLNASAPFNVTNPASVVSELEAAGVYEGSYHRPANVNLTALTNVGLAALSASAATDFLKLNNGWIRLALQGLYGNNYLARAFVASTGYLALVESEVIYPSYSANLSLASGKAYLYTFSTKPPLGTTGFWSLTMYNTEGFLVANPVNVYTIGDRSNLTYPNGSPVYGTKSSTSNGSFQVLIQSAATPPPANWTHNWLPSPANESAFSVILRLYSPTPPLTNGSWLYPKVTKIGAIVA